jgi:hypothetical protein
MEDIEHDQSTDDIMDTDQAGHLVVMTTKSGRKFWRVAIIRERLGAALHGGPLKPFSKGIKGLKTFCKTAFRGSVRRKSELETLNNLGVSTASPDEIPIFTTPPEQLLANEQAADEHNPLPKVPSVQPTETPALAEVVSNHDNGISKEITTIAAECTLPAEATLAPTTEGPLETLEVQHAIINEETTSQEEGATACAEVIAEQVEPVSPSLDTNPDFVAEPTPAPKTYNIIDTVIDTTSCSPVTGIKTPEVPTIVCTGSVAIEHTLDTNIQSTPEPVQTASPQEDIIFNTKITSLDKELTVQETSQPASTDHGVALVEKSESDDMAVVPELLDDEDDLESGTEIESEVEEEMNKLLGINVLPNIAHKDEEAVAIPMPVTVYPVFYEDDFDPAVSSICSAAELDELLDRDGPWFIPRIVEKAKLNRRMAQDRFANQRTAQGHYRNLNLESAARNLVLDIPAPVRVIIKAGAPSVIKEMEVPTTTEVGTPTTRETPTTKEVETPHKTRVVEPIPMAIGRPSRTHSRSSSGSSAESADSSLHSVVCPDTPLTEYSVTPNKDEDEATN